MLKITLILGSVLIGLSLQVHAAQKPKPKAPQVRMSNETVMTSIVGSYQRHDQKFMYLKVKGAKKMIKVPRKYSLNSPGNYSKGLNLKVELPLKELIALNK